MVTFLHYSKVLLNHAKATFNTMPHLVFITVYPILIGLLLSLPGMIRKFNAQGKWSYDWIKALAIGVPTLYGSTIVLLQYSPFGNYLPKYFRMIASTEFISLSGLVLGYTIIACIQKKQVYDDKERMFND